MSFFADSVDSRRVARAATALLGLALIGTSCDRRDANYSFLPDDPVAETVADPAETTAPVEEAVAPVETPEAPAEREETHPAPTSKDKASNAKVEVVVDAERSRIEITTESAAFDGFATDGERAQARQTKVVRGVGPITRRGMEELALAAPTLVEFLWTDAQLDADAESAFQALAKAPRLKKVRLTGLRDGQGKFPSYVLSALSATPSLVDLDLSGSSQLSAAELADVNFKTGFQRLERLNFYGDPVGDAGVDAIMPLADRLVWLNLDDAGITSSSAPKIGRFQKLTFLHVGRSQIDDGSLREIAKLTKLEKVHITRSNATEAGAEELRRALPNCVVVSQPEN